jgi:hypothetical protein
MNITNVFPELDFSINRCEMTEMITEGSRFMFHILLVHIVTHVLDGEDELFGMAILIYYVLFRKLINTKLNNIQSNCKPSKDIDYTD